MGKGSSVVRFAAVALGLALLAACTNNPYPDADEELKILYRPLGEPPRTLDPAVSYNAAEHQITGIVYATLLDYHYLARPYRLIPGLAREVPHARTLGGGRVAYRFQVREGALYQNDPAFSLAGGGALTREVVAGDVAFQLMRIADPAIASPVVATFAKIEGFREFSDRLTALREGDPGFASQSIQAQYAAAGGIAGVKAAGRYELEIVLSEPYPQLLYWFTMPFTAAVPWEAVEYWDGEAGRAFFKDHPVGAGPFFVTRFDRQSRIVLDKNPNFYGLRHPEWRAPAAVYPSEGEPEDAPLGRLDPAYVGRPLPFLDRVEFPIEKEDIPTFNKFLQGYYDASGILQESFDKMVHEGALSEEMARDGMQLEKSVDPDVYYIGFNMDDPVVGSAAGEKGRKLRQAMSLVVDSTEFSRIFNNGRGVPAQSPLPPGIFGYEADYANPYRRVDLARAQRLLAEAGYAGGTDPKTGKPLRLSFDLGDTSTRGRVRFQFFVNAWSRLGLDVEIAATNYNQFQEKVRKNAYQIFMWGWIADYPDPENFLFLLWGPLAQSKSHGPNTANFANPRYDELFLRMKVAENGEARLALIREMRAILERERPWIELFHRENYTLFHGWVRNVKPAGLSLPTARYVDIDPGLRSRRRAEWNRPVLWPAFALAAGTLALVIPGVVTFLRERQ
jgi:ABC-type transport system substrate-binding protein